MSFIRALVFDSGRLGVLAATCWLGVTGCKKPEPFVPPDSGLATTSGEVSTQAELPCPVDMQDEAVEWPVGQCAPPQEACEFGQECCCGRCAPSIVCECFEGEWGCYHTDFCFFPFCYDGGVPEVADGG